MPAIRDIYTRYWENVVRRELWILMICWYILIFYSVIIRKYWHVIRDQFRLQLTKENQRVCVVGDDAQSIYSFRGADIDNILYFTKNLPEYESFKLEQNYRSTQTIVCAANSLIEKNERQIRKAVFSEKEKGKLSVYFRHIVMWKKGISLLIR